MDVEEAKIYVYKQLVVVNLVEERGGKDGRGE